jgi:hypothetical protein
MRLPEGALLWIVSGPQLPMVMPMKKFPLLTLLPAALLAFSIPVRAAEPPAPAAPAQDDTQDRLATALRSFSIVQEENNQLKDAAAKDAADKSNLASQLESARHSIDILKAQAAVATEVANLQLQVRQLQEQIASLIAENADLKFKLATAGPRASSGTSVPTRPAQQ